MAKPIQKCYNVYYQYVFQGLSDDVEVAKLTRERDEMRALLDKFERHMAEVQIVNFAVFNFKC